jgi:hypothetical protein
LKPLLKVGLRLKMPSALPWKLVKALLMLSWKLLAWETDQREWLVDKTQKVKMDRQKQWPVDQKECQEDKTQKVKMDRQKQWPVDQKECQVDQRVIQT